MASWADINTLVGDKFGDTSSKKTTTKGRIQAALAKLNSSNSVTVSASSITADDLVEWWVQQANMIARAHERDHDSGIVSAKAALPGGFDA